MKNLPSVLLWRDACDSFEVDVLRAIRATYESDGEPDWPARRKAWNNWTDALCKDGVISLWQYENWTQPACCGD